MDIIDLNGYTTNEFLVKGINRNILNGLDWAIKSAQRQLSTMPSIDEMTDNQLDFAESLATQCDEAERMLKDGKAEYLKTHGEAWVVQPARTKSGKAIDRKDLADRLNKLNHKMEDDDVKLGTKG